MRSHALLSALLGLGLLFGAAAWAGVPTPKTTDKAADSKTGDAKKPDKAADKGDAKADAGPEEYLKSRGLRRYEPFWIVNEEIELNAKVNELDKYKKNVFTAQKDELAAEKLLEQKKAAVTQCLQQRIALRQQLAQTSNIDLHNRIVSQINDLGDKVVLLEEEISKGAVVTPAREAAAKARDDYMKVLLDLRNRINAYQEKYADLAADAKITEAIEAYNKAHDKPYKLGPSTSLASNDKKLKKFEEIVLADAIDIKRGDGSLWEISVVFNGNKPQTLELDTGASVIALSYEAAKAAGLTPSPSDPTIVMQLADGREVEAKKVIANSVRVGKFTVEKVECAVLGPEYKHAGSMLGLSFLQHFVFKLDTEKSKLVMTKIETSPAPAAPAKAGN